MSAELVAVSCKCFNAMEAALESAKAGDAGNSAIILQSIKGDGLLLQREASALCDRLNRAEEECQRQVEDLILQVNNLYEEEKRLGNVIRQLETMQSSLIAQRDHHRQSLQEAEGRYEEAREKEIDAQRKLNEFKKYFWLPFGIGYFLIGRELFQNNAGRASIAKQDKTRHERDMNKAESGISQANSDIHQAKIELFGICRQVKSLEEQREICHKELGYAKSMMSFFMQAVAFWEEMNQLIQTATYTTDHLQRIMILAAKRNTVTILRSEGTQTMEKSLKECWMEVLMSTIWL